MRDFEKKIQDAQDFIDNYLSKKEEDHSNGQQRDGDLYPSDLDRSDSSSDPSNLEEEKTPQIPQKFLPFQIQFSPPQRFKNDVTQAFRADLLTYLEVSYYTNKKLPSVQEIHRKFSAHTDAPRTLKDWAPVLDSIADSLQNRGISPYRTTDDYIDPKFAWAVSLVVNTQDKRTIPAKLKESGLTSKEWQAFLRRKRYHEYFQQRLDEVFDQDVKNEAKISLSRLVSNGDLQAIKYYNELTNIYRPEQNDPNRMVAVILTAVMEILATHVSSEILSKIAAEIRTSPSVTKVINAIEVGGR